MYLDNNVLSVEFLHSFYVPDERRRPVDHFRLFDNTERLQVTEPFAAESQKYLQTTKRNCIVWTNYGPNLGKILVESIWNK